uniref:Uncharacterized protein n=1 Tax=Moniliophthora roreri TaxID=221103 RepID=A0A0W0EYY1_MONRR
MIVGALGLFIFVTGHWLLTIFDLFQAFVGFKDGTQPVEYYNDPSAASRVTRVVFLSFTILIADSLMVYRLWIIWAFNVPVVIFPCLTIMGYLVAAIGGIVVPLKDRLSAGDILVKGGRPWVVAEVIFVALTNVYSTALIGSRISSMNEVHTSLNLHAPGSSRLTHVLAIFIESAFIYSAWGLVFIATFAFSSAIGPVFANTYPSVAGIAFALISARVEAASMSSNDAQSFTNPMSRVQFETFPSMRDHESGSGPVNPMQNHENEERIQMDSGNRLQ